MEPKTLAKWKELEKKNPLVLKKSSASIDLSIIRKKLEIKELPFSLSYFFENYSDTKLVEKGEYISPVEDLIADTIDLRKKGLPNNFLAISNWDEGYICVDCGKGNTFGEICDFQYSTGFKTPTKKEYSDIVFLIEEFIEVLDD